METPSEPLPKQNNELRPARPAGSGLSSLDVELPHRRELPGRRNLQLGILSLIAAAGLIVVGIFFMGSRALVPVATALATLTLLWLLARGRLLRQRNGIFLALGLVCLMGATVALFERAYVVGAEMARARVAQSRQRAQNKIPPPTLDAKPALLSAEMGVPPVDTASVRAVRVLKDSTVAVDQKAYLVKAGEVFPYHSQQGGEVVFSINDMLLSLPTDAVEIFGGRASAPVPVTNVAKPEPETVAQVTRRAQIEVMRRFPALGVKDSPENEMFVEMYRELRNSGNSLLKDPEWPLHIAETLAEREGWRLKKELPPVEETQQKSDPAPQ